MQDGLEFWQVLATCFGWGAAASLTNTIRQPKLPGLLQIFGTCAYAGLGAVGFSLALIHFNDTKSKSLLYFVSVMAGLGSIDVLVAVWSQALPGAVNYMGQKFIGKNLIGEDLPPEKKPPVVPPSEPSHD